MFSVEENLKTRNKMRSFNP